MKSYTGSVFTSCNKERFGRINLTTYLGSDSSADNCNDCKVQTIFSLRYQKNQELWISIDKKLKAEMQNLKD